MSAQRDARSEVQSDPRSDTPAFAVVGAVNHGKSSVVAAFAEDDDVRISPMPGETVEARTFRLRDLLVLHDTPGFQNPREALRELDALPSTPNPLDAFRRFVERFRDDPRFDAECRLLQPIVDGAGILYVVDGSRALRDINLCEMEILRRTGAPRLAIINRTTAADRVAEWKGRLDQHFNIVRTFDALHATFADRIDLIESLALIERGRTERLRGAARALELDRAQRIADVADLIVALVLAVLGHTERARVGTSDDATDASAADGGLPEHQAERLRALYMARIVAIERDAQRRVIALYAHRRVAPDAMPTAPFDDGLFAERTWQLLGLGVKQLVGVSTAAGGVAGAGIDAATLGHSLGLGALIGAATGGVGAYVLGKRRPEIAIGWPAATLPRFARPLLAKKALRFGGAGLVVGPVKADNFPWIVIDRALGLFACVHVRSHARRDDVVAPVEAMLAVLDRLQLTVAHWPDATRRACQAIFRRARDGKPVGDERMAALREALATALGRIADAEREIDAATPRPPVV